MYFFLGDSRKVFVTRSASVQCLNRYFKSHIRIHSIEQHPLKCPWSKVSSGIPCYRHQKRGNSLCQNSLCAVHLFLSCRFILTGIFTKMLNMMTLWNRNRLPMDDSPRCVCPASLTFTGLLPQRRGRRDTSSWMKSLWMLSNVSYTKTAMDLLCSQTHGSLLAPQRVCFFRNPGSAEGTGSNVKASKPFAAWCRGPSFIADRIAFSVECNSIYYG